MTDTPDTLDTAPLGNTRNQRRARRYCFTLNNYTNEEIDTLTHLFDEYVIGKETGDEGTPHLQGYVEFKNARSILELKKINNRIHWEKAQGSKEDNIKYCTKEGNFVTPWNIKPLKIITELKPWQKDVENIATGEPDDRLIHWYWEPIGNIGKTALIKYLLHKYRHCTFSRATKSADILTIAHPDKWTYLFDFARSQETYFHPWIALEQLKDGLISDSKLKKETRNIVMNPPNIIVFANWEPDTRTMSKDRWRIVKIC